MKSETPNGPHRLNICFRPETAPAFPVWIQNKLAQPEPMIMNANPCPTEAATPPRWMVVDDNKDVLLMMKLLLEKEAQGHTVECFDSPQAALSAFAGAPEKYEVVITDFEMPGIDGVELCRRLRTLARDVKVFLATGSGFFTEAAAAHAGFLGLLNKPFGTAQLNAVLAEAGIRTNPAPWPEFTPTKTTQKNYEN